MNKTFYTIALILGLGCEDFFLAYLPYAPFLTLS